MSAASRWSQRTSTVRALVVVVLVALIAVVMDGSAVATPVARVRAATVPAFGMQHPRSGPVGARSAPSVTLAFDEIAPGIRVDLMISGFVARVLNVSVCGNEGRRGSTDCDLANSRTVELASGATRVTVPFTMVRPPVPCPCVIKVSSERFDEMAVAPIVLIGHPIAEVVESANAAAPLQVVLVVSRASSGVPDMLRTGLGGGTEYDVTLAVKNTSTAPALGFVASVVASRSGNEQIRELVFPTPGELAPQGSWRHTLRTQLGAPVFGRVTWQASVTASGLSTSVTRSTSSTPWLFFVLASVMATCVLVLMIRLALRLARRPWPHRSPGTPAGISRRVG